MKKHNLPIKIELPEHFLEEEVRDGYTVSAEMKKVWAIELDLLAEFIRVCDKYKLKWYMSAGSMIGAVRHQGFVPWDDDIDVYMPRKDAEILLNIASKEFSYPYFLQTPDVENDESFFRVHPQLRNSATTGSIYSDCDKNINRGLFFDIFILDDCVNDATSIKSVKNKLDTINSDFLSRNTPIDYNCSFKKKITRTIKYIIKSIRIKWYSLCSGSLFKHYQKVSRSFEGGCNTPYYVCWPFYKEGKEFDKHDWQDSIEMDFECLKVKVPNGYHRILTKCYGDYMHPDPTYPTVHGGIVFSAEIPYTDYFANKEK